MNLRMLDEKDIDGMLEWMHDPKVNCYFRFDAEAMTRKKALDFIKTSNERVKNKETYHFAITDDEDEYLGTVSLKDIDWDAYVAEYAISLRSCAQGRGIGSAATKEILRYAFETLKLKRVFLNVLSDNENAIRLYKKCGFTYEGEFKNHVLVRNEIKSLKWFAILREEYMEDVQYGKNNA